jgi:hypothetical protein
MEVVITGLVAYHVLLLRAVKYCVDKKLGLGKSFIVGMLAGGLFALTVHAVGYLINQKIMLLNGSMFYTSLAFIALLLAGGIRCMDASKKQLKAHE